MFTVISVLEAEQEARGRLGSIINGKNQLKKYCD
jgi:hypothetical protein